MSNSHENAGTGENAGVGPGERDTAVDVLETGEPRAVDASVKAYGRMLWLYPQHFREEFADEMHTLFWDMCHDERLRSRTWPVRVWKKALPDLMVGAAAERSKMVGKALRSGGGLLGLKALMSLNGILLAVAGLALFANALWVLGSLGLLQGSEVPPSGDHPGWRMILPEKLVTQTLGAVCFCFGLVLAFSARGLGYDADDGRGSGAVGAGGEVLSRSSAMATTLFCGNVLIAFAVWVNTMMYSTLAGWALTSLFVALAVAYAALGIVASVQQR